MDQIGLINVPEISASGTFPLVPDHGFSGQIAPQVVTHQFLSANGKIEQRFYLGSGARRWRFGFANLTKSELVTLRDFWEARKGAYQPFTLNVPTDDGISSTAVTVRFENEPLSWEHFTSAVSTSVGFCEINTAGITKTLSGTAERFPAGALETALTAQVQEFIQLVKITTKTSGYPVIYLSDRRCTIGGQLYQARLLGMPSGISQKSGGQSDTAQFVFGNADKVMRDLANDVDLFRAKIAFSLFHVGTGYRVDLWTGEIVDFEASTDVEFAVQAVDGLYELTLQYPPNKISAHCRKTYNDGENCPFGATGGGHTANALDLVTFPSATTGSCDRGYLTPNGCKAHTMKRFFGGVVATPQSVRLKDNSQGHFGFGRPAATSTSQVSDTNQGLPLQEIYTDVPMPVKALLIAGRDEGDFYEGHAVIGAGPVTFGQGTYDSAGNARIHKLDGQPSHGYPGTLGLREIAGSDPAGPTDFNSLDQSGNQVGGDPNKVYSGASTYLDNFSAGVAALVIRRTDTKGFQLTTVGEHSIEAIVASGLKGWVWSGSGSRTWQTITNPIWIAVNMLLRGRSVQQASSAVAETYFDVGAVIAAAVKCDLTVPKLIGSGTETQFKFNGIVKELKPLRDWLQEVMNNCLGNYTFSNGKWKPIVRDNASSVASFSGGNMILGSLKLKPLRPALNQITVSFANSEYEFAADTIPVVDLDRVAYDGQPLPATFNLSGAAGKSMAGRIGQVRLKEGLGGSTLTEQRKARIASWKTTILALGTEVGQVVQVTDGEVPDGSMNFRLQSWRLNDDYTIDLEGSSVTASMYDSTAGAKPADVPSNPVPVEFFPEPLKSAWFPNQASPRSDDPLFDQYDKTFGATAVSETVSEASRKTSLLVTGSLPINGFLGNVEPPLVRGQSQATSGGSLKGGENFWARVYVFVGSGAARKFSPGSNIRHFSFEGVGTNSNQITVSDIEYPAGSFDGAAMFVGDDEKTLCWQADFSAGTTTMSCGFLLQGTYNAPSPAHKFVRAKVKPLIHGGTIGVLVSAVTSSTIVCSDLAGLGDDWSQRYLTVLNKSVLNFFCGAFGYNNATGTFTVSQNPVSAGVVAGDLLLIRLKPTTYTGLTIGDSGIVNGMFPAGAVVDAEKGLVIRGITPGQPHQLRRVVSNTATIYTVDEPFDSAPTYFIVEGPAWQFQNETSPITIPATGVPATISIPVDSLVNQPVVVGAFLIDRLGNETPEEFATIREAFIFGDDVGRFVGVDSEAFQVSPRGQALSGRIATGNRDTPAAGVTDLAFTGKVVCDGFVALKDFQDTGGAGVDDSTFVNADANAFNNTWILYRYNKALGGIEVSTAVAAGARVWPGAVIGSGGSGSTGPYVPVTGAASISLDLTAGSLFAIPLDRASTAIAATGGVSGQRWGIKLTVDGTAGRGVTWGAGFASGVLAPPGTDDISSGAAGVTFIEFVVNVSGDSECIKYSQK